MEVLEARIAPASILTLTGSNLDISENGGAAGVDTLSVKVSPLDSNFIRFINTTGLTTGLSDPDVAVINGTTIDVRLTRFNTGLLSIDGGSDTDSLVFDPGLSFGSVLATTEAIQLGSLSSTGTQTYHSLDITFASDAVLNSTVGGAAGADITLDGPVKSTSGNYRTLTITAGTSGDAIFGDNSGSGDANFATGTDALGGLTITAETINFQSDVAAVRTGGTTSSITLASTGASALTLGTNISVGGAGNVSITGVGIAQNSGSSIAPSNGTVTLDGTGGTVNLSGSVSGTAINLIGPVTQTSGSVLTTGTVTLTAGSGNDVSLLGTANAFTGLAVVSAHDVDAFSTSALNLANATVSHDFAATSSLALTLSGTVSVTNQLTLDAGTAITQSAGSISAAALSTSSHGAQSLTSTGNAVVSFTATNATASTDITLVNGANGFQIGAITNNGGAVVIDNTHGGATDTATLSGTLDSGGGHVLLATSGALTLSANLTAGAGTARLVSGAGGTNQTTGAITASGLGVRSTGAISLTDASNDVDTFAGFTSLTSGTGIDFHDADTLTIGAIGASGLFAATSGLTTSNAGISVVTAGDLTISDIPAVSPEIGAGTGLTSLTAGTAATDAQIVVAAGAVLAANNNQLRLIADHIDLSGDLSLTGASSSVLLRPFEAGTTIVLGGADAAGVLGLTDAELDHVTGPAGAALIIGSTGAGSITFTSAIDTANIGSTNLVTGGTVTQNAGATITEGDFSVTSTGAVTLTENNSVTNFAAAISGAGNAMQFKNTGALTVSGPFNGVNGVSTNGGNIALTTVNGSLTVNDTAASADLSAGAGAITLTAGSSGNDNTLSIASGANVSTTGGATFVADGMSLLGTVTATGALVALHPFESGTAIDLGGADASATLGLTDAELDRVTATTIKIGDTNTAAISITSALDTAGTGILSLQTGSTISQSATITEGSLAVRAVGAITLNSSNSIGTLAASVTGSGNAFQFTNNGAFTVGTVDGVTGVSTNGAAISLTSGTGLLTISNAVNAGTSTVTLTGDDAAINATVTGNGGITVQPSTGSRSIFLNNAGTGLSLATAELTNLATTGTLTIGASGGTGSIGIGGTSAIGLGATNYSLTLRGGAVTFSNGITLNSSKTFTFNTAGIANGTGTEVTSSGGTLVLNTTGAVTMDSAVANFGASTVSGGAVSVTNTSSLSVSGAVAASSNFSLATTGGTSDLTVSNTITGTGANLTLTAGRALTVSQTVSTTGSNISLIGDSMSIGANVTGSAGGTVNLRQNTNGTLINLGAADSAGVLGLTDAELDFVTGGTIVIGNTSTGNITVGSTALTQDTKNFSIVGPGNIAIGANDFTTTGNVTLTADADTNGVGAVTTGVGVLRAGTVTASSANGITLNTAVTSFSATNSTSGGVSLTEADAISVSGITNSASGGAISISTTSGSITSTGAVSGTGGGTIALSPGGAGNGLTLGAGLSTGSGAITIIADTVALNGGTNSISSTGALTLRPLTTSASIGLGDSATGTFNLSNAEINALTDGFSSITIGLNAAATHTVVIDNNNASLTFKDPVSIRGGTSAGGSLTLASGTSVVGSGNATLTLSTGGALTLNGSLSTANNNAIGVSFGSGGAAVNATIGVINAGTTTATVAGGGAANVITLTSTANPLSVSGGGGADTIVAPNGTNTWTIGTTTTLNTNVAINGNITTYQGGTGSDTFNFNNNRTLTLKGGAGADSFVFANGIVLTGSVDGEGGSDTLDVSAYVAAVNVTLTGAGATDGVNGTTSPAVATLGFSNINVLSGSGTFTGANAASTWAVGSSVTYTTGGGTVALTGYTTLQGGSDVDTFNVTTGNTIGLLKGGAGNDSLNLSYTGGNPIPVGGLTFNGEGNTGSGDSITVGGGSVTTITHTFTNANDGFINLDGRVVTYTGLEPITDSMSAVNRVFTFNGGTETITLADAAGANMTIDSTASESVTFANPTGSLTINGGDGSDDLTITSMDAAYTGSLTVHGDTGTDSLTFTAASPSLSALTLDTESLGALPTLGIGSGGLNITTTASDISQVGGITVSGATTLHAGANAITLSHASNDFGGAVTATVTGTAGITLNDSTGGITLAAISAVSAASVSVTTTGNGDITVSGALSAGNAAVSLDSDDALTIGNHITASTLGLTADSTIDQTAGNLSTTAAVTAIAAGNITLTSAGNSIAAFIATNTGAGASVSLENGFDGLQIGPVTANHGPITLHNTNGGPSDDATIVGAVTSGGTGTGDVFISTEGHLGVDAAVSTSGGSGGTLALNGSVTLSASPVLGGGDIVLQGGDGDLVIEAALSFGASYSLTSTRNVVIDASVATTGATSDLTLTADTDHDGVGGVYIKEGGFVSSSHDLFITGSTLTSDVGITETNQAVRIDGEGTVASPVVQVQAVHDITIGSSADEPAHVVAIAGYVANTNTGSTVGNIEFTSAVEIIDNTAFVSGGGAGSVLFDGAVDSSGGYDLKLNSTLGNINFLNTVGNAGPLGAITIVKAGDVTAASTVEAESLTITNVLGTATFQGAVTFTAAAGTSLAVHGNALVVDQVDAGAGDILWDVDNLALNDTVAGSGALTVQPYTVSRSIGVNGAGDLSLDSTEIAQLQAGFSLITIGRTDGTGAITTSGANFHDALSLLAPKGTINVNGKVATTGAAKSLTIQTNLLKLNVDSATDDALSTEGGALSITNTNVSLLANTKLSTSTGAVGGDVTITATINGTKDLVVDALHDAAGGDVTFNGMPSLTSVWSSIGGTAALRSLTVQANNISHTPNTITSGSQEYNAVGTITTHGGHLTTVGTGDITFNGDLHITALLVLQAVDVNITGRVVAETLSSLQFASSTVASSATVTVADTTGLFAGQRVTGAGIPYGTTILSVDDGTHLTLSNAARTSATSYLAYGSFGAASITGTAAVGTDTFTLTTGNTSGLYVGQPVSGTGVPSGATVAEVLDGTHFRLSANISSFSVTASIASSTLKASATAGSNAFTLTSGTTAGLHAGQSVSGSYLPAGTKILAITGANTFTTTNASIGSSVNPTVGSGPDAALSIVNTGEVHLGADVGNDELGRLAPLDRMTIDGATLVDIAGNVRVLAGLNFTANELDFNGGDDSIHANKLTILPKTNAQNITLGASTETLGSADLELSSDDVKALGGDAALITIGSRISTGTVTVAEAVTFNSSTTLQVGPVSPGRIDINADVTATGASALTIEGALIDVGADVVTSDGALLFNSGTKLGTVKVTAPAAISTVGGSIVFNTQLSTLAALDVSSTSGAIQFKYAVSLADDLSVTATGSGVTFSREVYGTTTSDLTVSAPSALGAVTFPKIGDGTVAHRLGQVTVNSGGLTTLGYVDATGLVTDAAGTTLLRGSVNAWGSAGIHFNDSITVGATITVASKGTGAVDFASTVDANATTRSLTLTSVSGDITLHDDVGSVGPFSTFSVRSTSGDVVADGTIVAASVSLVGATVDANATITTTKGITLTAVSALDAIDLSAGGAISLKSTAGHLHLTGTVNAGGALTASSKTAPILFDATINAGGAVSVTSTSGDLTFADSVHAGGAFTAKTTSGDVTIDDTVNATSATLQGDDVHALAAITTSGAGNQSYSGITGVVLDELSGGGNLTVTSKHDISNTGSWQFSGKATLTSSSTLGTEGIVVTGSGNSFGSVAVTGHKATIETEGDINILGSKITRVGLVGGTLTLTSHLGNITQTGTVSTYKLLASATTAGKKITFGLGTLQTTELGKLEAGSDILIVRGANSLLLLKDTVTSTTGDVIIVADYGTTTGNLRNDVATLNPISAGGRFLIYAYDESASAPLLSGISANSYLPNALQPRRYSSTLSAAGNPSQIPGTYFVFARH